MLRKNFEKTEEKHWSMEVNIPKVSVEFSIIEKFYNSFQKTCRKLYGNVIVRKIWITLAKNWKKFFKIFKKFGRNFEEIRNNFLNKFSPISLEIQCNFERNFKKLEEHFREKEIILKIFQGKMDNFKDISVNLPSNF